MEGRNKARKAASVVPFYGMLRQSGITRLVVCIVCCISMMLQAVHVSPVLAADGQAAVTFQELNDQAVFLKQSQSRVCTLTACAMMVRRTAMLMGDTDWQLITEQSIRKDAWSEGVGLKWDFTTYGITVAHKTLRSKDELAGMLDEHPEGIVIYNAQKPHAVLVTDYTDGVFYCSDPSNDMPTGRYPIAQASITVESAARCWYVKQPAVTVVMGGAQDSQTGSSGSTADTGQSDEIGQEEPGNNGFSQDNTENSSDDYSGNDAEDQTGSSTDDIDSADSNDEESETTGNQGSNDENAGDLDADKDADEKECSKEYSVDGLTYRILNTKERTAACTGQVSADKSADVPDTVIINKTEYQVVQIAARAFANSTKLKSVTIGANVSSIGTKAFYKCKKLKTVTINSKNLQKIGTNAFAQINKKAKIYVLADQMEGFGRLLTGTAVPGTVVVGVNQVSTKSSHAGK